MNGAKTKEILALVDHVIDEADLLARVSSPDCGAVLVFRGIVRNEHHGRAVARLEYRAYERMAYTQMEALASELRTRWPVRALAIVHRLGTLAVGDASVVIALAVPHRAAGFAALEHAIGAFKRNIPIWKKEHFTDGSSEWVHQDA
ncbi:MAG: molybdenum cofactor biosynthesis protein MoaE [Planctomycetota bacterium]